MLAQETLFRSPEGQYSFQLWREIEPYVTTIFAQGPRSKRDAAAWLLRHGYRLPADLAEDE